MKFLAFRNIGVIPNIFLALCMIFAFVGCDGQDTFVPNIEIGNPTIKLYLNGSATPLTEGGSTLITAGTGTYTVNIDSGSYSQITWYLNGSEITQWENRILVVLTKRIAGTYLVTVETVTDEVKNTGTHIFVVE